MGYRKKRTFFKNALNFANKAASNKIDAFLLTGDFTDCMNSKGNIFVGNGWSDDYEEAKARQSKTEFEILRRCFSEEIDKDAEIIYCLGNHDIFYMSSLFCYYPSLNDIPLNVWADINYDYSKIYTLSVTPQDVWYNCGKTVTYYF